MRVQVRVLLLISALAGALFFSSIAAKPVSPTLSVALNPLPSGVNQTVSGSGFKADQLVLIDTSHAPLYVTADETGGFSVTYDYAYTGPGNAGFRAYVLRHREWTRVAEVSFVVLPPD